MSRKRKPQVIYQPSDEKLGKDYTCVTTGCVMRGVATRRGVCAHCKALTLPLADIDRTRLQRWKTPKEEWLEELEREVSLEQKPEPVKEHVFDVLRPTEIAPCERAPKATINVDWTLWQRWIDLARRVDTEWAGYLLGKIEDTTVTVSDVSFPEQDVTSAHVTITSEAIPEGAIGTVHSHVAMDAFFSSEDTGHWNQAVHIVLNRKGEWKAVVRSQLPCGSWSFVPATVMLTGMPSDLDAIKAVARSETRWTPGKEGHRLQGFIKR